MKMYRLFTILLALIVMGCSFGVQAQFQQQYGTPSSGYSTTAPSASQDPLQYSQFYTTTAGPAPSNPIGAPQQAAIAGNMPSTVYLGQQMQSVPYSQYQYSPAYTGANSLWIGGSTAWAQYAVVPQGAAVSLFAISPTGGSGSLNFIDTDGQSYSQNYLIYPNSLITFYAGKPGRNTLSFAINGQPSNQVIIDVTASSSNNYPPYYQGYYPYNYYGNGYPWNYYGYGDNYPWSYWGWGNYPGYSAPSTPVNKPGEDHGRDHDHGGDHGAIPGGHPGGDHGAIPGGHPGGDHGAIPGGHPGGDHGVNPSGNPGGMPEPIAASEIGPFSNPAENEAWHSGTNHK